MLPGMVKANDVARWIFKASFSPEPRLILGLMDKLKTTRFEFRNLLVEGFALEVHGCASANRLLTRCVNGERAVADSGFEPSVVWRAHDQLETHSLIEGYGGSHIYSRERYLIQLHMKGPNAGVKGTRRRMHV